VAIGSKSEWRNNLDIMGPDSYVRNEQLSPESKDASFRKSAAPELRARVAGGTLTEVLVFRLKYVK
jgi:hypothetical protein